MDKIIICCNEELKKHNVSVAIADTSKYGMCQFSRLKDSLDIYTSHYENEKSLLMI